MFRLIHFKTERQFAEWLDPRVDSRLKVIIYAVAGFCFDTFGKFVTITEIIRTVAERLEIYKDNPEMAGKVGVHEVGRAMDIRTIGFTPQEIAQLLKFLNENFEYDGKYETAVYHDVVGFHIHLQVDQDGMTSIKAHAVVKEREPKVDD